MQIIYVHTFSTLFTYLPYPKDCPKETFVAWDPMVCGSSFGHFLHRLRNMAPRDSDIFSLCSCKFFLWDSPLGHAMDCIFFQLNQQQINDCICIHSDDYTLTDFKYSKCNIWVPSGNDIPFLYQSHRGAQRTAPLDHLSNVTAAKQTRSERMPACAETRGKFKPQVGQRSWSMDIDKPW